MDGFELREELRYGGGNYLLQTSYIKQKKEILSSFFRNGTVFDSSVHGFDDEPGQEELKKLAKNIHNQNKRRLRLLLDARESIGDSRDPASHLLLARALSIRNLHSEAISEAMLAIEKGAKDSSPYIVIGSSWYQIGDYSSSFEAVKKGIEISPDFPDLHNLVGMIYLKMKKCGPAVESFKRAIGLDLYYGEPYLNLARAYLLNSVIKEDYELSRDMEKNFNTNIKRAVQLNPFLNTGAIDEVKKLFKEEKYEEALSTMDEVRSGSLKADVDAVILELYLVLLQNGEGLSDKDIEQYQSRIEELIDQNPTFADAYNALGVLYTAKCKIMMDKSYEAFRKALKINSKYSKARKNMRLTENDRQGIFILLKALLD